MISNWFRNCWGDLLVTTFYVLAAVALVWFLCGLNAGCIGGDFVFIKMLPKTTQTATSQPADANHEPTVEELLRGAI